MKRITLFQIIVLIALLTLGVLLAWQFGSRLNISNIREVIIDAGLLAPAVFIALYILVVLCFLPALPLTLAAGLVWGAMWGTLFSMIGALTGGSLAFLIARYWGAAWVAQRVGKIGKRLFLGIEQSGWKFVAVIRLVPVFPFAISNYAFGVTPISFRAFWLGTAVFMLPGVFAYAYLGSLGEDVLQGDVKNILGKIFLAAGIFILLACVPWILKLVRQDTLLLQEAVDQK